MAWWGDVSTPTLTAGALMISRTSINLPSDFRGTDRCQGHSISRWSSGRRDHGPSDAAAGASHSRHSLVSGTRQSSRVPLGRARWTSNSPAAARAGRLGSSLSNSARASWSIE